MWVELLIFGSVWFWVVALAWFCLFVALFDHEKGWASSVFLGLTFVVVSLFTDFSPLVWIWGNPVSTLALIAAWFAIGSCWMILKWKFWLVRRRDEANILRKSYDQQQHGPFNKWVLSAHDRANPDVMYRAKSYPPYVLDHKSTIVMWMTYWPFSMFWTILNDPIYRISVFIYKRLGGFLQRMSDNTFNE